MKGTIVMRKNRLKVVLLALFVTFLTACGDNSKNDASTESSNGTISEEKIEIEYWHANADTQGGLQVTELVDKFNESQDSIVVTPVFNSDMYVGLMQNLQTAVAGNNVPAVVQIGWAYREYFDSNFESIRPEELVEKFGSDNDYIETKFIPEMAQLATNINGEMLGFPYSVSSAVVFVNNDILDEANVDPETIKTFDDLYGAADQIKEETGKYGLFISLSNDNWTTQQLIETYGDKVVDEDGMPAFAGEAGIQAIDDWYKSIEAGSTLHVSTDEGNQSFVSGDVGLIITTIAQRSNILDNADFEASAIELPYYEGNRAAPAGGAMLSVTALEEEEQKAAMEFIEFLYEPENIAIWTSGTGYLPPTEDATEDSELNNLIDNDQMFGTAYAQMSDLVPFFSFPGNNGLQASEKLREARDRIFTGVPASEELPKVEEEIKNEL